jgi:putative endonuclease
VAGKGDSLPKPASAGRNLAVARRAELAVADYLVAHGFRVLARNVRLGALELDLVACCRALLVVVEVRTRGTGSYEGPFESIGPGKRRRIVRAVDRLWRWKLAANPAFERVRIDAAAVTFDRGETRVEYVPGAISG